MGNRKVVIGVAALVVAAALIGVGAFAAFTDTESTSVNATTGALDITGAEDISIQDLAPGDVALRGLTVTIPDDTNEGDLIRAIRMSVPLVPAADDVIGRPTDEGDADAAVEGASLLTGDNGLQLLLASCSGEWSLPSADDPLEGDGNGDGIDDSATCDGTVTVTQQEIPLADLVTATEFEYEAAAFGVTPTATGTIPDGSTLNLIAQLRLPAEADNAYENASLSFDFLLEAVQREGVNR